MNVEAFREHCLAKTGVTESFPFDGDTLVFKVMNKMFALCNIAHFESFNAKCDPEKAMEYREHYSGILPGWHMNKKHWNTVMNDGSVPDHLMLELTDHSYELVVESLSRRDREALKNMQ